MSGTDCVRQTTTEGNCEVACWKVGQAQAAGAAVKVDTSGVRMHGALEPLIIRRMQAGRRSSDALHNGLVDRHAACRVEQFIWQSCSPSCMYPYMHYLHLHLHMLTWLSRAIHHLKWSWPRWPVANCSWCAHSPAWRVPDRCVTFTRVAVMKSADENFRYK